MISKDCTCGWCRSLDVGFLHRCARPVAHRRLGHPRDLARSYHGAHRPQRPGQCALPHRLSRVRPHSVRNVGIVPCRVDADGCASPCLLSPCLCAFRLTTPARTCSRLHNLARRQFVVCEPPRLGRHLRNLAVGAPERALFLCRVRSPWLADEHSGAFFPTLCQSLPASCVRRHARRFRPFSSAPRSGLSRALLTCTCIPSWASQTSTQLASFFLFMMVQQTLACFHARDLKHFYHIKSVSVFLAFHGILCVHSDPSAWLTRQQRTLAMSRKAVEPSLAFARTNARPCTSQHLVDGQGRRRSDQRVHLQVHATWRVAVACRTVVQRGVGSRLVAYRQPGRHDSVCEQALRRHLVYFDRLPHRECPSLPLCVPPLPCLRKMPRTSRALTLFARKDGILVASASKSMTGKAFWNLCVLVRRSLMLST